MFHNGLDLYCYIIGLNILTWNDQGQGGENGEIVLRLKLRRIGPPYGNCYVETFQWYYADGNRQICTKKTKWQ